jgi:hypothetical protein
MWLWNTTLKMNRIAATTTARMTTANRTSQSQVLQRLTRGSVVQRGGLGSSGFPRGYEGQTRTHKAVSGDGPPLFRLRVPAGR